MLFYVLLEHFSNITDVLSMNTRIYKLLKKNPKTSKFDILHFIARFLRDFFITLFQTLCYTTVNAFLDKKWKAMSTYSI